VYKYINDDWVLIGNKIYGSILHVSLGYYVSMDDSGTKFCAGAIGDAGNRGSMYVYEIPHTIESSGTQLITNCDVSMNEQLFVAKTAVFNSDVDICGNFHAQYQDNTIPLSAIIGNGEIGVYVTKEIEYDDSDFAIIKEDKNTVSVTDYSIFISNEATYDADGFAMIRYDRTPVIAENLAISGNFDISGILSVTGKLRGNPDNNHIDTTFFKQF
jgi:hypothetical protein